MLWIDLGDLLLCGPPTVAFIAECGLPRIDAELSQTIWVMKYPSDA
jgi:hypothetical protein